MGKFSCLSTFSLCLFLPFLFSYLVKYAKDLEVASSVCGGGGTKRRLKALRLGLVNWVKKFFIQRFDLRLCRCSAIVVGAEVVGPNHCGRCGRAQRGSVLSSPGLPNVWLGLA